MEKISLSCPKCRKNSEVLILAGVKGILTSWSYRCQFCRLQKNGGFWFLDCILYCLFIAVPLVLFFMSGMRFADIFGENNRLSFLIVGFSVSLSAGFWLSRIFLKYLLKFYLFRAKDSVPNILL